MRFALRNRLLTGLIAERFLVVHILHGAVSYYWLFVMVTQRKIHCLQNENDDCLSLILRFALRNSLLMGGLIAERFLVVHILHGAVSY